MALRRFKVVVAYDGHNYAGWQRQNNALGIQQVIEDILSEKTNRKVEIVSSGRTDALVHAYAQVFHFDTDFYIDETAYFRILNSFLPKDIRVKSVEEVNSNFHARFSAKSKVYIYKINLTEYNPFLANYAYQPKKVINIDLAKKVSQIFIGKHDFSSFCNNGFDTHPNQVREIYRIDFSIKDDVLEIEYEGNGFLRYMVRMLTATIVQVALGRINIDDVQKMLDMKNKEACKYNIDACGLYLKEVKY